MDAAKPMQLFRLRLAMTGKAERTDGRHRAIWYIRPLRPADEAYFKQRAQACRLRPGRNRRASNEIAAGIPRPGTTNSNPSERISP